MDAHLTTPYAELVRPLICAIMRAQGTIVRMAIEGVSLDEVPHQEINRHFSWLAPLSTRPSNRHIVDGLPDGTTRPLLNRALRYVRAYPPELAEIFQKRASIPTDSSNLMSKYVRWEPTRISNLIINAFKCQGSEVRVLNPNTKRWNIICPSPLLICSQILTVPDSTGSSAYSFLATRSFLINEFNKIPKALFDSFDESSLSESYEFTKTSMRDRYYSRGKDKLPLGRPESFTTFFREFLCFSGLFNFRFKDESVAVAYLSSGEFRIGGNDFGETPAYEYDRRAGLNRLPEVGDLANQIWGLPIPIRGADVIFRGGLKFPSRNGLVAAIHGGPGTGKTSIALGIGASLAGFGIRTLFFSAEELEADLTARAASLIPAAYRRLSFFPRSTASWLDVMPFRYSSDSSESTLERAASYFKAIADRLTSTVQSQSAGTGSVKSPCRLVVVLDGLHELVNRSEKELQNKEQYPSNSSEITQLLHKFIEQCKELKALVILTTGESWEFGAQLDYLVDTAIHLKHETSIQDGGKPERLLNLTKARHQSCAAGTHGFQISGEKGVRFTPQTNFCLELDSIWDITLSDEKFEKRVLTRIARRGDWSISKPRSEDFIDFDEGIRIFKASNIFLNGEGSGGKAGMALKIASAPYYVGRSEEIANQGENILIISFLYPKQYYINVHDDIKDLRGNEIEGSEIPEINSRIDVIQFYPGFLKSSALFSRIEWRLREQDLLGDPFTTIIIDGLHNIFIQFPELEKHQIIWPQIYSMLRRRDLTIITTHTVLMVSALDTDGEGRRIAIDDNRSDPLRHALVQKTDFSFEIDPIQPNQTDGRSMVEYEVKSLSAIGQPLPRKGRRLCWHRENLFFYEGMPHSNGTTQPTVQAATPESALR